MSIRAYVSAIGAADVLPAVLARPIAEYARRDDAYFVAEVLGRNMPYEYTFIHDDTPTRITFRCYDLHNTPWNHDTMIMVVMDVSYGRYNLHKRIQYDDLARCLITSHIVSSFRDEYDNETVYAAARFLHAQYLQVVEGRDQSK
jgi:hypothetical protein